jgi:hypothetical protein
MVFNEVGGEVQLIYDTRRPAERFANPWIDAAGWRASIMPARPSATLRISRAMATTPSTSCSRMHFRRASASGGLMRWLWILIVVACAHSPTGELRFRNEPPVWRVNDRIPLAKQPRERIYNRKLYHSDSFVVRRSTRALDVRPSRRAADVNALDEVPDSTWFTNRIGVRDLSIAELVRGPNVDPSPFENLPWTITKAKSGGTAIGFVFEDTTGAKFILKFDTPDRPEMETAAHAIVHRILWACGYNEPQDHIGYIRRADLVIGDKARKRGIDDAKLDAKLAQVALEHDGRIRVLASRYLPGKPIGGYPREGTRADDPNMSSHTSAAAACVGSSRCSYGSTTPICRRTTRSMCSSTITSSIT